ncbi:ornithine carbamoyltransferase [Neomegalonema sp.]|uniref:ornithine carbamoyltransferase n=1 Tax=Neomegalonema sp. TaxID=2039713 RepID=UPI00262E507B|nr:ornithine carbamoyltransferase [Neomegalonema sp.]MDD2869175.1 ornithine carbamoyltransferase [Neomegalonema sp.]
MNAQEDAAGLAAGRRHFLDLHEASRVDLRAILTDSERRKRARAGLGAAAAPDEDAPLKGKMLAMIFEKSSTRTRVSFDLAMRQLGGATMVLNGAEMQFGRGETIADTARVLSRYVDAIMIRTFEHDKLLELAEAATVPVINGLTDKTHPCQILADVLTFEEHRGPIRGKKVAWLGDGNNVCASFIHAAGQLDFELVVACPESLSPDRDVLEWARKTQARVSVTRDPGEALTGADLVVTDSWMSMHDPEHTRIRRHNLLSPYQVDEKAMKVARPDALFMHCLPAHRGEEVTNAVMDGPNSVVFDEAENRLHAQKGVLNWCLGAI